MPDQETDRQVELRIRISRAALAAVENLAGELGLSVDQFIAANMFGSYVGPVGAAGQPASFVRTGAASLQASRAVS